VLDGGFESDHPDLADAVQRLYPSADKIMADTAAYDPVTGRSAVYGYGRVNVGRAVDRGRRLNGPKSPG
jgi:hypothetical protein